MEVPVTTAEPPFPPVTSPVLGIKYFDYYISSSPILDCSPSLDHKSQLSNQKTTSSIVHALNLDKEMWVGSTPPAQLRIFLSPSSQTAPLLCHEDCYGNSEVCLAPRNKESLRPCRPLAMEMPARALVLLIVHLVRGQDHLQSLATWVPLVWLVQRKCPIASPSQGRVPPHTRYSTDRTMQGGKCSPRLC